MNELKYCKFCDKEKPIQDFTKSGFAIKNICRECQNKKNNQIYKNSKKVEKLEQENKQLKDELKNKPDAQITLQDDKGNKFMIIQTERIDMQVELNKTIEKLFNNWNKLKEYIKETKLKEFEKTYGKRYGETFTQAEIVVCNMIMDKMQEIEQGSDNNE